jgi:hypothetical protein
VWSPLNTPDYVPYITQIQDCDVVCQGLTGSNPLKFTKAYHELGLKPAVLERAVKPAHLLIAEREIVRERFERKLGRIARANVDEPVKGSWAK